MHVLFCPPKISRFKAKLQIECTTTNGETFNYDVCFIFLANLFIIFFKKLKTFFILKYLGRNAGLWWAGICPAYSIC